MDNLIAKVENLHVSFPSNKNKKEFTEIVRGVSFDIPKKSIIGFIGESGSGKSVTAKSLLAINNNSKTKADLFEVDGINLLNEKKEFTTDKAIIRQIRGKKVAYVPQDSLTSLNPTMKVGAQIIEALKLHARGFVYKQVIDKKEELKRVTTWEEKERISKWIKRPFKGYAADMLERFGISNAYSRLDAYPHEFSGGMRQRVVISMMVACRPDIIIADEPTTALDPTVQASVLNLFQRIVKEFDMSILFISHDISVIATLCDYINVFYAGRIVERGTKKDIFTDPRHPYTWSLLAAMPEYADKKEDLFTISGKPPSFNNLPKGDPFSVRNPFAIKADFKQEPPLFKVKETHYAATWLLHPASPKIDPPKIVQKIIAITEKEL